jgi:hypothetical protein
MNITPWIKATRSTSNGGDCVEMRRNGGQVNIRDSKNPAGDVLAPSPTMFAAWLSGAKKGEFDHLA